MFRPIWSDISMRLAAGAKLGPYEILAPIGSGGMGEVYRATDHRQGRDVAVKLLPEHLSNDSEALYLFEKEMRALAALSHPNILNIHDFSLDHGTRYAVMELLNGEVLRETMDRGQMSLRKTIEVGILVAEGLAAAHSKGVIHLDVKPENIFLTSDGQVKILDFALARMMFSVTQGQQDDSTPIVETSKVFVRGTLPYMSPEQLNGLPVDSRSD